MTMASSVYGMTMVSSKSPVSRSPASRQSFGQVKKRDLKFRVRSMGQEDDEIKVQAGSDAPPKTTPDVKVQAPPPAKPKEVSISLWDVMAFGGPGPERINGRLAMIGFAAAMGVEIGKGQDIFWQVQNGGIAWFVGTSVLLSVASLIPMSRGVSAESKSGSLMTSDAELWNGRFAMLGLLALAFTEYLKGGPLVV